MPKKVATGDLTVLKKYKSIREDNCLAQNFVHNKIHIVESAIANIQQTLGYKIMLMIALKCLLYKFTYTHCTLTTKHLSHYTTSNGGRKELHKGNEKFVFRPQDSISELSRFRNAFSVLHSYPIFEDKNTQFYFPFHEHQSSPENQIAMN